MASAACRIAPGVLGQERDLRGAEPVAQHVEEREVLQRVRPDRRLAALHGLVVAVVSTGHELGGDLGVEHVGEHVTHLGRELPRRHHPPDQVLDQRLRHARVDVVVRHLVADAVGAPAQRQLREVTGAQHDPAALVGRPEEVVGAQPGLHVLERHVVHRLACRERMPQLAQHEPRGLGDVELGERHAERLGQADRVALRAVARREARQREREDVRARPLLPVHRLGRHDQRVGRVKAARNADHDLGVRERPQPLLKACDLDVVGLEAVLGKARRVGGHEREALDRPAQPDVLGRRREPEPDLPKAPQPGRVMTAVVVERAHPQPLRAQQVEIDIGHRPALALREALRLGEQHAVLPDHRLAVPREVGGRLAFARRGVHVRGEAARRRRAGQQRAVLGPADRDRAAGQVGQHRRACQRRLRRRRDRHPHVFADLDVQHEPWQVVGREQQFGPDRHLDARHPGRARRVVARCDLAALVELPVGRQVRLRREPQQPPPVHDGGHVHDPVPVADRQPDDQHRQHLGRSLDHGGERPFGRVQQRILQEDVLDRVTGQRQLGEDREPDAFVGALARDPEHGRGVRGRIADRRAQRAGGDP